MEEKQIRKLIDFYREDIRDTRELIELERKRMLIAITEIEELEKELKIKQAEGMFGSCGENE